MTTALNGNTQYCHLVSRQDADSLVVPGTVTTGVCACTTSTVATSITMANGANIVCGTGSGTKIGTGTTQKIGFYNKAPVALQTGVAVDAAGIHAALVALGLITA